MRAASSPEELDPPDRLAAPCRCDLRCTLAGFVAVQDVIFFVYLAIVGLMVWASPPGPSRTACARVVSLTIAALGVGCLVGRVLPGVPVLVRRIVYRAAIVGTILANYLTLRDVLALVRPDAVDEALVQIDLRLFGVEPALWLERFNQRPIVEWFSFFYFSYFFICGGYMVTIVWLTRAGRRTAEFAVGCAILYCLGQLGYTAVPGYGPVRHLESSFHGPINGGFWWSMVWSTVQAGGAMKDIFPSLHTAVPLFFTLYAFHQARTDPRWRWIARITGFFSANIIFSTMFLRWHYGIDVLAGLVLSLTTAYVTPRIVLAEEEWRAAHGHVGPWCFASPRS